MNAQNNPTHNANQRQTNNYGMSCVWDQICDPGTYICNWSGHLLRVPEDGVAPGRSPLINFVGPEPLYVTMISDNPFITITKARMLASNLDLDVNF